MARGLNPCAGSPPKPSSAEAARRRALGCPLCELEPDDPVTVRPLGGDPVSAAIVAVSQTGITVDLEDGRYFFPWASGVIVSWEPVRYTTVGTDPE